MHVPEVVDQLVLLVGQVFTVYTLVLGMGVVASHVTHHPTLSVKLLGTVGTLMLLTTVLSSAMTQVIVWKRKYHK